MNHIDTFSNQKKIFLSIILLLLTPIFFAQSSDTLEIKDKSELVFDSLVADFNTATIDTVRINILNEIAWEFAPTNFEKSILHSDSAQTLAKEIGWEKGEAIALKNAGDALRYNGKVEEAISKFEKCLPIFERLNDVNEVSKIYLHLGLSYGFISQLEKSHEFYNRALTIYLDRNDTRGTIKVYIFLGNLFYGVNEYNKSLSYYKKALSIAKNLEKNSTYASILANIGMVYSEQNKISEALLNYQRAGRIFKEFNDLRSYARNLGNIGDVHLSDSNFSEAIIFSKKALYYSRRIKAKRGIAFQSSNLAEIQFKYAISDEVSNEKKKSELLSSSIKNFNESNRLFSELGNKVEQFNGLKLLSKVYQETKNFELAINCLEKANLINDSLQVSKMKQAIADAEHKMDIDLKKQEIAILKAENEYNNLVKSVLLTLALVLIILVGYFYHQYLSIKHHSKLLEENIRIRGKSTFALKKNEQELKNHKFQLEMIVNKRISKLESEVNERKLSEERLWEVIERVEGGKNTDSEPDLFPKNKGD